MDTLAQQGWTPESRSGRKERKMKRTLFPVLVFLLCVGIGCYSSHGSKFDVVGPTCGDGILDPGEECDDGNDAAGDGCDPGCTYSCHFDSDCSDGQECSQDECAEGGSGRLCTHRPVSGWCLIEGTCFLGGSLRPGYECQGCYPSRDPTIWTLSEPGTACDNGLRCDGELDECDESGQCVGTAPFCPEGACSRCDEASLRCFVAPAGEECRPAAGSCDVAEACDGVSTDCPADVYMAAGSPCDDADPCTVDDACNGLGACVGDPSTIVPPAPKPLAPENGEATGSTWASSALGVLRPRFRWSWPGDGCGEPSFDIQVDDSCPVTGFETCGFPSPEAATTSASGREWHPPSDLAVSMEPPVGRRYFWRMRACRGASCSGWSPVRYLDVGRAPCDLNGDGYSDLVVGAYKQSAGAEEEGNVFIYLGGEGGVADTPSFSLDNPENNPWGRMGWKLSSGDLNADGFMDLVVTASWQNEGAGVAFLYMGSEEGPPGSPDQSFTNPEGQRSAGMGDTVTILHDVDLDGFSDLVIGAPFHDGADPRVGAIFVYDGGPSGVDPTPETVILGTSTAALGSVLSAAGDVNADGYADLLSSASNEYNTREVFLYLGSPAGVQASSPIMIPSPYEDPDVGNFSNSLSAAGDVNGDGYGDFLVGDYIKNAGYSCHCGAAWLYLGGDELSGEPALEIPNPYTAPGIEGFFGTSLTGIGDADQDGLADIIVGASGSSDAFVFRGSSVDLIDLSASMVFHVEGGKFGHEVAFPGDLDGDGYADVAVGAPEYRQERAEEGAVFVYYGGAAGFRDTPSLTIYNPTHQLQGYFGWSIATALSSSGSSG